MKRPRSRSGDPLQPSKPQKTTAEQQLRRALRVNPPPSQRASSSGKLPSRSTNALRSSSAEGSHSSTKVRKVQFDDENPRASICEEGVETSAVAAPTAEGSERNGAPTATEEVPPSKLSTESECAKLKAMKKELEELQYCLRRDQRELASAENTSNVAAFQVRDNKTKARLEEMHVRELQGELENLKMLLVNLPKRIADKAADLSAAEAKCMALCGLREDLDNDWQSKDHACDTKASEVADQRKKLSELESKLRRQAVRVSGVRPPLATEAGQ
ncbi:hypothetical protein ANO11243_093100 [Dothideomycetidae sp. 11243]|nr:hypothetical protein ANO11243_093100 [fungal sp. No.11243]